MLCNGLGCLGIKRMDFIFFLLQSQTRKASSVVGGSLNDLASKGRA